MSYQAERNVFLGWICICLLAI